MARTSIEIHAPLDHAWTALQQLRTWEGVAGIEDLKDPAHCDDGNLAGFRFATDTAVGRVAGQALVVASKPIMTIQAEQKGLEITLRVALAFFGQQLRADVHARSRASSFFNKPLELTLNALLDNSIGDEAAKIASRIG